MFFYSPTCPHCVQIAPVFEKYSREFHNDVVFAKLDVSESISVAREYGVMATPTFKFFCKGRPVQELVGAVYPPLIKKVISDVLNYAHECTSRSTPLRDAAYA